MKTDVTKLRGAFRNHTDAPKKDVPLKSKAEVNIYVFTDTILTLGTLKVEEKVKLCQSTPLRLKSRSTALFIIEIATRLR